MKTLNKIIKKDGIMIVAIISIILFILITLLVLNKKMVNFDNKIYALVSKWQCNPLTFLSRFISFLCSTFFLIVYSFLLIYLGKNREKNKYVVYNILGCFGINQMLKLVFRRIRPVGINLVRITGFSFPSGHAMMSMAFYGLIIYLILHKDFPKEKKMFLSILFGILILLIGISRIYLGCHYASDILAGYLLGLAYLLFFIKLFNKKMT